MIINSNSVSLTEASELLVIPETEVLRLSQYGYLEQSKTLNGKTRIALHSIEKYPRRNNPLQHKQGGGLTTMDSGR